MPQKLVKRTTTTMEEFLSPDEAIRERVASCDRRAQRIRQETCRRRARLGPEPAAVQRFRARKRVPQPVARPQAILGTYAPPAAPLLGARKTPKRMETPRLPEGSRMEREKGFER